MLYLTEKKNLINRFFFLFSLLTRHYRHYIIVLGEKMNQESEEFLKNFISTHNINSYDGFYIKDLYKLFMDHYVTDINSFLDSPDKFSEFCVQNISLFRNTERHLIQERIAELISSYARDMHEYISHKRLSKHVSYVNIVKEISPFGSKTRLLDVGPGRIPYSSMLLAKDFEKIRSMDSVYYPSITTLNKLGIDATFGYFSKDTDLKDIDLVVGQAPCTAIEAIAENCAKTQTPYFIETCGCCVPELKTPRSDYECFGWEEILPAIDPNISFHKAFMFNLNLPANEVKSIINRHILPKIRLKPYTAKKQEPNQSFLQNADEMFEKTLYSL